MSTFTPSEVDALENGGNKRARKIWLATFDELKSYQLDPEDPNNIDRFMQLVYVDKKWAKPANAPVEEEDKKPKKKRKDSNVPDAFETTFPASVAITSTPTAAASKPAPQQSTPPKSQPTVDLGIDFLSNLTISTPAPAQQPASASTSQPFQSNEFGSNGLFDAPTATSNGTTSDPVDEFVAFFKRQQQQHNASPSTVAGWVQKALAIFSNGRAAAASSSFDASTANSAASNSQAAFQPQQQQQHQDAFADIDIPGDEDGDTGNPFDSSDDEDEPQPNGNCQNKCNHGMAYSRFYWLHVDFAHFKLIISLFPLSLSPSLLLFVETMLRSLLLSIKIFNNNNSMRINKHKPKRKHRRRCNISR